MIAEMGLGKTIQVIALLAYLELKTVKGPFIICAPLATLPNWMNELKKWLPSTKAALFHGTKEHRNNLWNEQFKKHLKGNSNGDATQVMVTSYEIAILERSKLEKVRKYMIVDEGQRIKNRDCRLVRELKKLPSENRLLLTGTLIQNTLEELWSLLNFVNPMISTTSDLRVVVRLPQHLQGDEPTTSSRTRRATTSSRSCTRSSGRSCCAASRRT